MRRAPVLSLVLCLASCATIEVQSDRDAEVYAMGPGGMELEGSLAVGETLSISRLFSSSPIEILCFSKHEYAHEVIPAGTQRLISEQAWGPASDLLATALTGRIEKRMSEAEVTYAWGRPRSASESEDGRILEYERGYTLYFLFFKDDRLSWWSSHELIGYYGPYYWPYCWY